MAKLLGFENVNFKGISGKTTCLTEKWVTLQRSLIVLFFLKYQLFFWKAMGCLGRWLIAKYRFFSF